MYLAISMLPGSKFTISERNTFMSLAAPAAELYREIWSGDRDRQVMEAESKRKTERVCFKWRSGTEWDLRVAAHERKTVGRYWNNIVGKKQMGVRKKSTRNSILFNFSFPSLLSSSLHFKVYCRLWQLYFLYQHSFFSHKRNAGYNMLDINWVTQRLQGHKQN